MSKLTKVLTLACLKRYFLNFSQRWSEFLHHYQGQKSAPKESKLSVPSNLEPSLVNDKINVQPNITTYNWTPCCMCSQQYKVIRAVGAESARAPPDFGKSVNPISPGIKLCSPDYYLLSPPLSEFSYLPTALSHQARHECLFSTFNMSSSLPDPPSSVR